MAHIDNEQNLAPVVPLDVIRMERMLEKRIIEDLNVDDFEGFISVKLRSVTGDELSPDDLEMGEDDVQEILGTIAEALSASMSSDAELPQIAECDFVVARMRCHKCKHVSKEDISTQCETFFRHEPDGSWLKVGDWVGTPSLEERLDYYTTRCPDDEVIHILEGWECPRCTHVNWAEIVVESERIKSVWSVALSKDSLERAHLVSSECVEIASQIAQTPPWQLTPEDVLDILKNNL